MAFGVIIASHKCHCNIVWPHIETVDLKGTEVLKASRFVLHSSLKLECGSEVYTFKIFAQVKKAIACITESCNA